MTAVPVFARIGRMTLDWRAGTARTARVGWRSRDAVRCSETLLPQAHVPHSAKTGGRVCVRIGRNGHKRLIVVLRVARARTIRGRSMRGRREQTAVLVDIKRVRLEVPVDTGI